MDYQAVARSERALIVGDRGLLSAYPMRLHFAAGMEPVKLVPGKLYLVSIQEAPSEEDQAAIDADLRGLSKAQLVEKLMELRKPELVAVVTEAMVAKGQSTPVTQEGKDPENVEAAPS